MKKSLLVVMIAFFSVSLFAQNSKMSAQEISKISATKKIATGREVQEVDHFITTPTMLQRASMAGYVGLSYYTKQSNASVAQRVISHDDGSASFTWLTSSFNDNTRGTGYNYYTGELLRYPRNSTARIESNRTGWPTMGAVTSGSNVGEVVISHNGTTGLEIMTRTTKGEGEWTQNTLLGPALTSGGTTSTALLWPSIATSGTTIHLLACTDSEPGFLYQGIHTCLLYYTGEYSFANNTITWSEPRIVGDVTSDYIAQFSGDSYAIATNGDRVAILVCSSWLDNFYWLSEDGGTTWGDRQLIYETSIPERYNESTTYVLDTAYVSDGNGTLAIGDNGTVHVALGLTRVLNDVLNDARYNYFPGVNGLLYWNSTMGQIPNDLAIERRNNLDPDTLAINGWKIFKFPALDETDTAWYGSNVELTGYGTGSVSMPQFVTDNNNIYLIYSSLVSFPFIYRSDALNCYFRGVFAEKSTDNGATWPEDEISWLSYGGELFNVDWDAYSPHSTDAPNLFAATENVYPAVASKVVNGKINMLWQSRFTPHEEGLSQDPSDMFWLSIDANDIGTYNNTRRVYLGEGTDPGEGPGYEEPDGVVENSITDVKIYPNPATNQASIVFTSVIANAADITITNVMGQTVLNQTQTLQVGNNKIDFDLTNLNNGFYLVNINTPTGKITQKLIIQ